MLSPCRSQPNGFSQDRALYASLLTYASKQLPTLPKVPSILDPSTQQPRDLLILLCQQVVKVAKRECGEKAKLLELLFGNWREWLALEERNCERKMREMSEEYVRSVRRREEQWQMQAEELGRKLAGCEVEGQKWRTFYMIVRDNRVLRRQKGKLLRVLTEQRLKLTHVHEEMIEIAKENQKNKLLADYEQTLNLDLFLKNHQAIVQLEKFMQQYPRYAKKLLHLDLQRLQTCEEHHIDQKIDYILKAARQSDQIFDQYEDLIDLPKNNKLIFNISTQTTAEDINSEPPPPPPPKPLYFQAGTQTKPALLLLCSNVAVYEESKKQPNNQRRRRAMKLSSTEDSKILEAVKHFRPCRLQRRVFNLKINGQDRRLRNHLVSWTIKIAVTAGRSADFPTLPTNHRLQRDIRRSKELTRRDFSKRSSRLSSRDVKEMQEDSQIFTLPIKQQTVFDRREPRKSIKGKKQFFISPQQEMESSRVRKDFSDITNLTQSPQFDNNQLSAPALKKTKANLKQIIKKNQRPSKQLEKQAEKDKSKGRVSNMVDSQLTSEADREDRVRKSGFVVYRNSKLRVNTLPEEAILDESSSHRPSITRKPSTQMVSYAASRMSYQTERQNQMPVGERPKRGTVQNVRPQKMLNIVGAENLRLAEKVVRSMGGRKRQILQGKLTLQTYLRSFLITQYGAQMQVLLQTRSQLPLSPLLSAFDRLLSHHESTLYLQLTFRLFARIWLASGDSFDLTEEQAQQIFGQVVRSFASETRSEEWAKQFYFGLTPGKSVNPATVFLAAEERLHSKLLDCELVLFLRVLLPRSQQSLHPQEVKNLLGVLQFEEAYGEHICRVRQLGKNELPFQALLLYALREEWQPLLRPIQYLTRRYHLYFGPYEEQSALLYLQAHPSYKCEWSARLAQSAVLCPDEDSRRVQLQFGCLAVLQHFLDRNLAVSELLGAISMQCAAASAKRQVGGL